MLSAATHVAGGLFSRAASLPSSLAPLGRAEQIHRIALLLSGPVQMALLAAGLLVALRVLWRLGFWVRPKATGWAVAGIVVLFTLTRFAATAAGQPTADGAISLLRSLLLCVLSVEALFLWLSAARMGRGADCKVLARLRHRNIRDRVWRGGLVGRRQLFPGLAGGGLGMVRLVPGSGRFRSGVGPHGGRRTPRDRTGRQHLERPARGRIPAHRLGELGGSSSRQPAVRLLSPGSCLLSPATMNSVRFLCGLLAAAALSAQPQFFPLKDIRPGLKGVGKTVFSGTRVEEFQVEILGVLENIGPKQSLILARLSGGPLAETGVLQGMSGSPVYIDGRLAGAVAMAFAFSKEPIAGIRPIEEMVQAAASPRSARAASRRRPDWQPGAQLPPPRGRPGRRPAHGGHRHARLLRRVHPEHHRAFRAAVADAGPRAARRHERRRTARYRTRQSRRSFSPAR